MTEFINNTEEDGEVGWPIDRVGDRIGAMMDTDDDVEWVTEPRVVQVDIVIDFVRPVNQPQR